MRLTPRDREKLMLHTACVVAQKRYARGIKLNYPETIALISGQLLEFVREGYTLREINEMGKKIIGTEEVMPGVVSMIEQVQVEGTFPDGTKLISIHNPICESVTDGKLALYGSGLMRTAERIEIDNSMNLIPGQIETLNEVIILNDNRKTIRMEVTNTGTRPIQVGSHCNFTEVNKALAFDRVAAIGFRLNIPAGTAIRLESGETKTVELVEIAGEKLVFGGNNIINGAYKGREQEIATTLKEQGFID